MNKLSKKIHYLAKFTLNSSTFYFSNTMMVFFIAFIIIFTNVYTHLTLLPSQHIAWHILGIERWLAGGKYYSDFYEINTPFATSLYFPAIFIAKLFKSSSIYVISYFFNTFFLTLWAFFCAKLISFRNPNLSPTAFNNYFLAILWSFLILPSYTFADRDPFIGAFMLPYTCILFSLSGFKEDTREKKYLMNAIASFAVAYALLIKPYYFIALILIQSLNFIYYKKLKYSLLSIAIVASTITLGMIITFYYFPEWFEIWKITLKTYSGYNTHPLVVAGNIFVLASIPIAYFKITSQDTLSLNDFFTKKNSLAYGFLISSIANIILYIFQFKGWYYHTIPALMSLWIFSLTQPHKFYFIAILLSCVASFNIKLNYELSQTKTDEFIWKINTIQKYAQKNDKFICISINMSCNYPLSFIGPYQIASRYPHLSAGAGAKILFKNHKLNESEFKKILMYDIKNSTEDIIIKNPKFIIIEWQRSASGTIEDFSENLLFSYTLNKNYTLISHKDFSDQSTWIYFKK
ncbi:MAG: hypothetical protein V4525_05165 [Pseudomonadota bacterium]